MIYFDSILITVLISFLFGGILGSFSNMLIYRLPLEKSIIFPNSFCPKCQTQLSWKNLIPVISFCLQKGRCSFCKQPIHPRYLVVELLFIVLTFFYLFSASPIFLNHQFYIFSCICFILFFTDLEHYMLPFYLNTSLSIFGILFSVVYGSFSNNIFPTLIFLSIIIGFRALLNFIYKKETFGIGDIILLAGFCCNWGWLISLLSFYFASITGGLFCIFLLITKKKERLDYIAFGPYLIIGFYCAYFFHPIVIHILF